MTEEKSIGRSGQNDAGMSTTPCELRMDRPDTVELTLMRKSYRVDRVQVDKSPDGLPEGWIMEIRPRKRGQRTDKYYIDPVHGCGLLSKVDVYRYLKNKEEFQVGYRIERIHTTDDYFTADESIPILRLRKRNRSSSWKPASTYEGKYSEQCHEQIMDDNLQTPDMDHSKLEGKAVPHPDGCTFKENKNQSKKVSKPSKREVEKAIKESVRKSKRLAGEKNDLFFDNDTENESIKLKSKKFEQSMQQTVPKELNEEKLRSINHTVKETSQKADTTEKGATKSDNIQNRVESAKPSVSPPGFGVPWSDPCIEFAFKTLTSDLHIEDAHISGITQEKPKNVQHSMVQASRLQPHANAPLTTLGFGSFWLDPCVEFAFKTLTSDLDIEDAHDKEGTREKFDNIIQPSVEQASQKQQCTDPIMFGDSWSDPCIEFAFRTLTSDFSSIEDIASVQDYFHHEPFLSQCSNAAASVSAMSVSDGKTESEKWGGMKIHYERKFN